MQRAFIMVVAAVLFCAAGCSTTTSEGFTKVKDFHLEEDDDLGSATGESMIAFERSYLLHGAVTQEDVKERLGYYYTFFWRSNDPAPVTLRFQYRHGKTGEEIHEKEQLITNVKSRNVTHVQLTGEKYREPYAELGKVVAWRASLWRDGKEIASERSFLWQ